MNLPQADARRISTDRLDLLLTQAPIVIAANIVNPLLLWAIVGTGRWQPWAAWCALQSAVSLVRFGQRPVLRRRLQDGDVAGASRALGAQSLASGLSWGVGSALLIEPSAPSLLAFSFVVGGMVTAAAGTTAVHLPSFMLFAWSALPVLTVRLWTLDAALVGPMPYLMGVFALLMTGVARRTHDSIGLSFRLRHENAALVGELGAAKHALWEANQDLEAKVKERTAELAEQRARLSDWIRDTPDGLLTLVDCKVVAFNPAALRILRSKGDTLMGRELATLPGFDEASAREVLEVCKSQGNASRELRITTTGAATHYLEVNARRVDGQTPRVELVVRDVTERRISEARVHLMNDNAHRAARLEAIRRLAGGVAHELNNVLSVILGHTELALKGPLEAPVREHLEQGRAAAQRAAVVSGQLLSVSQRRRGKPRPVDLNAFLSAQQSTVERLTGRTAPVEVTLAEGNLTILADESLLEEVLFYVILYASAGPAANGQASRIELRTSRLVEAHVPDGTRDHALLELIYEGPALARRNVPGVSALDVGSVALSEADAFELAEASRLITEEGGFLEALEASEHRLHLRLGWPLVGAEALVRDRAAERGKPISSAPPDAAAAILVVDDEPALRQLISTALTGEGYVVLVAKSGSEALERCAGSTQAIRALLTDVVMPGMDGPTLARRMLAERPKLRVCFMSGYTGTFLGESLEEWPGALVLEKPFSLASLFEVAEKLMRAPS